MAQVEIAKPTINFVDIIKETLVGFDWKLNTFKDFYNLYIKKTKKYGFTDSQLIQQGIDDTSSRKTIINSYPKINYKSVKFDNEIIMFENLNAESKIPIYLSVDESNNVWIIIYKRFYHNQITNFTKMFETLGSICVYITYFDNFTFSYLSDNVYYILCNFHEIVYCNDDNPYKCPKYLRYFNDISSCRNSCKKSTHYTTFSSSLYVLCVKLPYIEDINLKSSNDYEFLKKTDSDCYITNFSNHQNLKLLNITSYEKNIKKLKKVYYCFNTITPSLKHLKIDVPIGNDIANLPRNLQSLVINSLYTHIKKGDLPSTLESLHINSLYHPNTLYVDKGYIKDIIPDCKVYSIITCSDKIYDNNYYRKIAKTHSMYYFIPKEIVLNESLKYLTLNAQCGYSVIYILNAIHNYISNIEIICIDAQNINNLIFILYIFRFIISYSKKHTHILFKLDNVNTYTNTNIDRDTNTNNIIIIKNGIANKIIKNTYTNVLYKPINNHISSKNNTKNISTISF